MTMRLPILMYHSISERPTRATAALAVRPAAFADQMALLRDRGFTPLPFCAVFGGERVIHQVVKPVVITFDDGYADFHENALPVLAQYGFAATLFVTTGWLADAGPDTAGRPLDRTLRWTQVREAAAAGIEVGGHSHSHSQLDQLSDASLTEELTRNKGLLEERLGSAVTTMAYPYGYSSARVRRAVRAAGYIGASAVANRMADTSRATDPASAGDAGNPTGAGDAPVAPGVVAVAGGGANVIDVAADAPASGTGGGSDPLAVPRLTVRWSMSLETFGRVVEGDGVGRVYAGDRVLTKGYAIVRRTRSAARVLSRHG